LNAPQVHDPHFGWLPNHASIAAEIDRLSISRLIAVCVLANCISTNQSID